LGDSADLGAASKPPASTEEHFARGTMNEEGREERAVDVAFFLLSGAEARSGASGWAVRMRESRCLSGRKGGCISQFVVRENEYV
jgi:hypothetical protein